MFRMHHPVLPGVLLATIAAACLDTPDRSRRIPISVVRDRGHCGNWKDPVQVGDSALIVVLGPHGFERDSGDFDWTVVPPHPGTPGAERPGTVTLIARMHRAIVVGTQSVSRPVRSASSAVRSDNALRSGFASAIAFHPQSRSPAIWARVDTVRARSPRPNR